VYGYGYTGALCAHHQETERVVRPVNEDATSVYGYTVTPCASCALRTSTTMSRVFASV